MCTYDPASSTTRMRRRPSHAKVLGAVWVDMLYMVLLVAVVMILMKVLGDLGYDATVPIGVLVGGIVLLFIKILRDSVADVHRATTQHQSTAAPHGVWPPTPPSPTEGTLPRDLGRILNFVTPMLLTMLLMMFIGGFRDQVAANFIVNPERYEQFVAGFITAGVGLMGVLWLAVYQSIPILFRHQVYLQAKSDPWRRHQFFLASPVILITVLLNFNTFPKAMLELLHEHSPYTVFQQEVRVSAKSYQDDHDVYQLKLQSADGQTFWIGSNEAIYDQVVIGSTLRLSGSETPYGKLVVDQSVVPARPVGLGDMEVIYRRSSY